mmetsp:Transcript_40341/g.59286  ORF Transcript_40341/g.59286 Transcript_40341/m.59286 type:complete len:125 (-) Transcript_40341:636-1010(-)|eukprot:CAMPEP_0195522766 /NCGR_PEP_ID=MMETSP0794_2-20130614/21261_1 /TAXON_ID=515487 /ORGANISM="Stephanopyxis turris, Strain CCMP 815" /LENGTH=124 /DNA_ID=CAMNT_0040652607 /DNA_START=180 /DNA_END=554 /DNA_ORIENTATION=+
MAPAKRTVESDGRIASGDEDAVVCSGRTSSSSPPLRSRIPDSLDVFGFSISPGQFLIVQFLATVMLGFNGSMAFLLAFGAYTLFQHVTSGNQNSSSRNNRNRPFSGGSNIRGMGDLPKPPPSGG